MKGGFCWSKIFHPAGKRQSAKPAVAGLYYKRIQLKRGCTIRELSWYYKTIQLGGLNDHIIQLLRDFTIKQYSCIETVLIGNPARDAVY